MNKPVTWKGIVEFEGAGVSVHLVLHPNGALEMGLDGAHPRNDRTRIAIERQLLRQFLAQAAHLIAIAEACQFSLAEAPFPTSSIAILRGPGFGAQGEAVRRVCDAAERQKDWGDKLLRAVLEPRPWRAEPQTVEVTP